MYSKQPSGVSRLLTITTLLLSGSASATSIYSPNVQPTTVINGFAVRLDATLFQDGSARPWRFNALGGVGECLRFDVTGQQSFDLELVVVAPDGTVYRSDDRGPGDLRPLVKISAAPNAGWYTVHVADFSGRPIEGDFTIMYGRYPAGNINCNDGTNATHGF